jgi:hypothetical protein
MQALIGVPSEPASGFELDAVQALYRLGVNMLHRGYEEPREYSECTVLGRPHVAVYGQMHLNVALSAVV